MKIHSDIITGGMLESLAIRLGGEMYAVNVKDCGSRIRKQGVTFNLRGSSNHRPNMDHYSDEYAATWDEWGMVLGALYLIDPNMLCGSGPKRPDYEDAWDFHRKTNGRFRQIRPTDMVHKQHNFRDRVHNGLACTHPDCTAVDGRWVAR